MQILLTTFVMVPAAVVLYLNPEASFIFKVAYWAFFIFMLGPHLLMLHNVCHRSPWIKSMKNFMDYYLEVVGLLFGLPPRLYYYHHIKMHHKEGNGPDDLSSTEKFQRDSFLHWLVYFLRFIFLCPFELPLYFLKRGRKDYALTSALAYVSFYSLLYLSYDHNPSGTVTIFIVPTLICWFGLMAGNWTQHAFVDSMDTECPYKNSITVVESVYNKRCFNDGYHIGHHLKPGMHWTEMPEDFEKNSDQYNSQKALVFKTLDYQMIWFLLMFKKYSKLATYCVSDRPQEETIQIMQSRLKALKN